MGKRMGCWRAVACLGVALVAPGRLVGAEDKKPDAAPKIQVAILLDTSNSMDGLIHQARTQLWKIVGEFTTIRLAGKTPKLEVALYEYGNDGLNPKEGFLRLVVPFTPNLDKVSEAMFALRTNGGLEYCGKVVDAATKQLLWSDSAKDVKCIFIAGNEPFTQGDVDYVKACKAAAAKGIAVNTIFCGPQEEGIRTNWQHGAQLADGSYMSIDQDQVVAAPSAPQDKELTQLGVQPNATYLAYGDAKKRVEAAQRQAAQDANAARSAAGAAAARASFKASGLYRNADWDLVDAVQEGKVKLESLKEDQLPEPIRNLSLDQKKSYIQKLADQRKLVQGQIAKASQARKDYLAAQEKVLQAQMAASAKSPGGAMAAKAAPALRAGTFERAVTDAVKAQAEKK